jgi:hypothetical protein
MNRLIKDIPNVDNTIYGNTVQNLSELTVAKRKLKEQEDERNLAQNQ